MPGRPSRTVLTGRLPVRGNPGRRPLPHYVRSLINVKVLILDDLGVRNYTHEEATSLIDIIEERYRKAPIIVTSQVEPQGCIKLFEDPVIAEAASWIG